MRRKKASADYSQFFNSTGVTKVAYLQRGSNVVTNNARIEAFGVHVRALLDFFYGLEEFEQKPKFKRKDDDVFAEDFLDKPEDWRNARPSVPIDFDAIRTKVNKQIAHITYEGSQVEPEAKRWLFGYIRGIIKAAYDKFRGKAVQERLGERWGWSQ